MRPAVADFMIDGHFARHLKQMRRLYAERRNALVSALRKVFGDRIVLDVPTGGMHVIGRIPGCRDDVALAASAQRGGLGPFALSSCAVGNSVDSGLLLSFTNIPVEAAAREAQRLLDTDGASRDRVINFGLEWTSPAADQTLETRISGVTVADLSRDGMLTVTVTRRSASARLTARGVWFARTAATEIAD